MQDEAQKKTTEQNKTIQTALEDHVQLLIINPAAHEKINSMSTTDAIAEDQPPFSLSLALSGLLFISYPDQD
ncbi:hypothetical protein CKAN_02350700 [Cinnamomum micranthum f. kanehirae]|uniref:Uncharacterized protein n=1 Tax=Cinnamomum micranthum f. kanehirae TaxID=337451 RepID=A0A3S3P621_9MAGN|nr:hypothetical protein CKAN_02350700 [Cinnamomum micranthum f. kanehirae]